MGVGVVVSVSGQVQKLVPVVVSKVVSVGAVGNSESSLLIDGAAFNCITPTDNKIVTNAKFKHNILIMVIFEN